MRAYIATTAGEISTFMKDGSWEPVSVYAPTIKFTTANNELDEEEAEYEISLLAASVSLTRDENSNSSGFVLALEVDESLVAAHNENTIELKSPLLWEQVDCLFICERGDDELTWYARQEISDLLDKINNGK
ncbi:unannotated protein [freshwater metagenome]|uniref:Unannotated protein n=1 Tax=freshwater metagenome TaxID=449393 RepID=A0A6J7XYM2_9ZZZZ|nr:hypothetical protein [Actinomycetota bacterium]